MNPHLRASLLPSCLLVLAACVRGEQGTRDAADGRDAGAGAAAPHRPLPPAARIDGVAWNAAGNRLVVGWERRGVPMRLYGIDVGSLDEPVPAPWPGLPLTGQVEAHPTWVGSWIAYESRRDGNADVYRMRPDRTGEQRLTDHEADDEDPAFSPDGRRLAFISSREGGAPRLHTMDAAGSGIRRVPFEVGTAHADPAWSPDGRRLAVTALVDGVEELYVVDPSSGDSGRLGAGSAPAWSSDGSLVFFERGDTVFSRPDDGGDLHLVVPGATGAAPAPDGRRLAFVRRNPTGAVLYVLDLETGSQTRMTR